MTGIFVRILRDGSWRDLELDELTDPELEAWAVRMTDTVPAGGWAWAVALAKWIRDSVRPGTEALLRVRELLQAGDVAAVLELIIEGEPDAAEGGPEKP